MPGKKGNLATATRCYRAALTRLIRDALRPNDDPELDNLSLDEETGMIMLADALQGMRRL